MLFYFDGYIHCINDLLLAEVAGHLMHAIHHLGAQSLRALSSQSRDEGSCLVGAQIKPQTRMYTWK
jgi:hypothetical protein